MKACLLKNKHKYKKYINSIKEKVDARQLEEKKHHNPYIEERMIFKIEQHI